MAWPTAKTSSAAVRVTRCGTRSVASAIVGAPTIMPIAKTVIARPAAAMLTEKSAATAGSSPATTNSVVPMRKVPAVST